MAGDHALFALRLYRYRSKNLIFGRGAEGSWKEAWLALNDDDTLIWYNDKHCSKICGKIPEFSSTTLSGVRAGRVAERYGQNLRPRRPNFMSEKEALYLTVPKNDKKNDSDFYWFYTKSDTDLLTCLLHFAEAAGREREFRHFLEQDHVGDSPRSGMKIWQSGSSLKGDSRPLTALREDLGVVWEKFIHSQPTQSKIEDSGHDNQVFIDMIRKSGPDIEVIDFEPAMSQITPAPSENSDILHDADYCSSRTTESAYHSCRDERSDSEPSSVHVSTRVSVEVHSSNSP